MPLAISFGIFGTKLFIERKESFKTQTDFGLSRVPYFLGVLTLLTLISIFLLNTFELFKVL